MSVPAIINKTKWELAKRLSHQANIAEDTLRALFNGVMQEIEKERKNSYDTTLKTRIWNKISEEPVDILKRTFLAALCEKVLSRYTKEEIEQMLQDQNTIGIAPLYEKKLAKDLAENRSSIIDQMVKKVEEIMDAFIDEIIEAIKGETNGIPKKITPSDTNIK